MSRQATLNKPDAAAVVYQHQGRIYRYIRAIVQDPAEAEDLTQDALVRAYCKLDSLRNSASFTSWLYRIATHVAYDRLRRRARRAPLRSDVDLDAVDLPDGKTPSVLETVAQRELSAHLQRHLDVLSDTYRVVVLLHDVHGLTGPQTAAATGLSLPNVKIRLRRARAKLRAAIEADPAFCCADWYVPGCKPTPAPPARRRLAPAFES